MNASGHFTSLGEVMDRKRPAPKKSQLWGQLRLGSTVGGVQFQASEILLFELVTVVRFAFTLTISSSGT